MDHSLETLAGGLGGCCEILMYHQLARPPRFSGNRGLCVAPWLFRRQMLELRDAGFRSGSLRALTDDDANAKVVLTFDDGFANAFEAALPVLSECGFSAIQFIVAERRINQWDADLGYPIRNLMDDCQIRDWIASGHEIGSHSLTHPHLTRLDIASARREIFESKARLEDRFQRQVANFCYPYGDLNPAVRDLVVEAGYQTACSTESGSNSQGCDLYRIRRRFVSHRRPILAAWLSPGALLTLGQLCESYPTKAGLAE